MTKPIPTVLLLLAVLFPVVEGMAQSPWTGYQSERNVAVEFFFVQKDAATSPFNGGYFLTLRIPIVSNIRVLGELPVGHTTSHFESRIILGNIGLGAEVRFSSALFAGQSRFPYFYRARLRAFLQWNLQNRSEEE